MATELAKRVAGESIKFVIAAATHPALALAPSRVVDEGFGAGDHSGPMEQHH